MNMQPDPRQTRRYRRIVLVLQLLLGALLIGMVSIAGISLFGGADFLFVPTPTLTPTPAPRLTPTPDFRARIFAEDRATQEAYRTLVAESGGTLLPLGLLRTPTPEPAQTVNILLPHVAGNPAETATPVALEEETPSVALTPSVILLPDVVNNPQPESALPTPTDTPLPTDTPAIPTETPLPTDTPPAAVPTATPTPFLVQQLRAFVTAPAGATLYAGPSTGYTTTGSLAYNTELTVNSRDETGEWLAACCIENQIYWLRQASAPPRDNALQPGAPAGAEANDVRWLAVRQAPPTVEPILTPTAVPANDYPFYRMRHTNNALVPVLPKPFLNQIWFTAFEVGPHTTPVLVTGDFVIVTGGSDSHIYALDRPAGNQQRSFNTAAPVAFSPVAQERIIYYVDTANGLFAVNFDNNPPAVVWNRTLEGAPQSYLYLAGNRLFVAIDVNGNRQIIAVDRINSGTVLPERYNATASLSRTFAVGNQLLYVGDPGLRAIDVNRLTVVWEQNSISDLKAPPVFVTHGPFALAELYVTDQNRFHIVDANTGRIIRTTDVGMQVTGLAVGRDTIYVTATDRLLAWDRVNNFERWRAELPGTVQGGPIIDNNQVLVVTDRGAVRMFDVNGVSIFSAQLNEGAQATAAPAVSGNFLYIPSSTSRVQAFQGQP